MAGKSAINDNFAPGPPATRYNVSGKNREFYTFENAPGLGNYATGGTIIDGGDGYIYHIFTGDGTFAVNRPSAAIDSVDYLIVAGGGSALPGGQAAGMGGGGGGGFLFGNTPVTQTSYPVEVGGAGPSTPGAPGTPRNGSPSWFGGPGTLESTGGGGGAFGPAAAAGGAGGSGGGGVSAGGGGTGNTPATIPRQGYGGGSSVNPTINGGAGGGGGAGGLASAGTSPPPTGGAGGPGRIAPEFPSTIVSKAISSPVLPAWNPLVGSGGYAAGGTGAPTPAPLQRTSPANSGYGGQNSGYAGGSGIVCVRYKKTAAYSRATGGTVEPSTNPEHIGVVRHIFTSPGDFTVTDPTLQYIEYLAVGGGGGGGGIGTVSGGGGAGGFVSSIHTSTTTPTSIPQAYPWNPGYSVQVGEQYPVGVSTYPIGIGTGGNSSTAGNNTTIGNSGPSQIIAAGGGSGGFSGGATGGSGGSGGGSFSTGLPVVPGGTATPSPLIQGNPGGNGGPSPTATGGGGGGGGGGASAVTGGAGWYSVLSPSSYGTPGPLTPNPVYRYFAGGGGGSPSPRSGGAGGGGPTQTAGTTNTGGGGGGAGPAGSGATGGPGIVIIQYPE